MEKASLKLLAQQNSTNMMASKVYLAEMCYFFGIFCLMSFIIPSQQSVTTASKYIPVEKGTPNSISYHIYYSKCLYWIRKKYKQTHFNNEVKNDEIGFVSLMCFVKLN